MDDSLDKLKKLDKLDPLIIHKLRSPLTSVRMYSEALLSSKEALTAEQKDYLTEIHNASLRMGEILTILDPQADNS